MDCEAFERNLDRLLAEMLSAEERGALRAHAESCARCGKLLAIMEGELDPLPEDDRDALTHRILAQTTGPACAQATALLPDYSDGFLSPDDAELVARHLQGCAHCAALAQILGEFTPLLPELAEIEPDRAFVSDVLARTSERGRWREAFGQWWRRQVRRPRFAMELAYCCALALVLIAAVPGSPIRGLTPDRVSAAWSRPADGTRDLWESTSASAQEAAALGEEVWTRVSVPAAENSRQVGSWITTAASRLGGTLSALKTGVGGAAVALWQRDLPQTWLAIEQARGEIRRAWDTEGPAEGKSTTKEPPQPAKAEDRTEP